jgi:hypothetical protein
MTRITYREHFVPRPALVGSVGRLFKCAVCTLHCSNRAHISGQILNPDPEPELGPDQLRVHSLYWQGVTTVHTRALG